MQRIEVLHENFLSIWYQLALAECLIQHLYLDEVANATQTSDIERAFGDQIWVLSFPSGLVPECSMLYHRFPVHCSEKRGEG